MATLHYVIYPSALGTPSAAQVKAGQGPTGAAATAAGSETALTSDGTQTWASLATGLTAATGYKIAFVWTDAGTDSAVVVGTFSTLSSASAPVVAARATEQSTGNSTGYSVGLPAGIAAGNLLVAVVTVRGTLDPTGAASINTSVSGTNWSVVGSTASASHRSMVFAKVAEGGDALSLTSGTSRGWSSVAYRITGAAGVPVATAATGSDDSPNPPSATASGNANRLWIAARSATGSVTATIPSGYASGQFAVTDGGTVVSTASSERTLYDATENPGAFAAGVSADWVAWTIYVDPVVIRYAQADQTVPAPTQSASASVRASATASQALPAPGQSATAATRASASSTQSIPAPTQAATASARASATSSATVPAPGQTATAAVRAQASGAQAVPAPTQTASAAARVQASGAHAVPAPVQSTTARAIVIAQAAQSVPAPAQVAVVALGSVAVAQADQVVPAPVQTATAAVLARATGAQAVPPPTQAATAQARVQASADQAVPAPAQTAVITLGDTRTATADQLVPAPTQSATATVVVRATAVQLVPAPTQVAVAAQGSVATAQADQLVPAPMQVAAVAVRASMSAAQQVERVLTDALLGVRVRVAATQLVPMPTQVGVVLVRDPVVDVVGSRRATAGRTQGVRRAARAAVTSRER